MKTERRHEIETNNLADWIGHQFEQVLPYSRVIAGGVLAVLLLAIVWGVMQQREATQKGAAWAEYLSAMRAQDDDSRVAILSSVATDHAGTVTAWWARQTEADIDLERGARLLFSDREAALQTLERAEKNFLQVEDDARRDPTLVERARLGAAQALECQGKLDKARQKYEQLAKANPQGMSGKFAAQRVQALSDPKITDFYSWFETQKPNPIRRPGGLFGDGLNPRLDGQSDRPDFGPLIPGPAEPAEKSAEKPATEEPSDKPAEPSDKPADKPAEPSDKPADKPADAADKPADKPSEKPAEKPADAPPEKNP
ncbi:MAG: hypothetical protein ACKOBW_14555 [Planctomycetota bacterium]